jgi:hypothetical protein
MRRSFLLSILIAVCQCLSGGSTHLGAEFPSAATEQAELSSSIDELVRQLGDDSYEKREAAQQDLLKIGAAAKGKLEEATSSADPEIARRASITLEKLRKQIRASAEVHVVGLYESRDTKALVEVRETKNPVILVLCAYESVTWSVRVAENVELLQVIAAGYHEQFVEGAQAPVSTYSYDQKSVGPDGHSLYFYTYDHDEEKYPNMVAKVRLLTGNKVKSFEGRYGFKKVPFVIGGKEEE